jgi:hypothetical protein
VPDKLIALADEVINAVDDCRQFEDAIGIAFFFCGSAVPAYLMSASLIMRP